MGDEMSATSAATTPTSPVPATSPASGMTPVSGVSPATEVTTLTVLPEAISIVVKPGETVLEAMHAAGLGYRTGCRRGGCGVCKVDLVDGTVTYPKVIAESVMTPQERGDGTCLTCHAVPTSDVTITLREERLRVKLAALLALRTPGAA